jgi:hypothetical protein
MPQTPGTGGGTGRAPTRLRVRRQSAHTANIGSSERDISGSVASESGERADVRVEESQPTGGAPEATVAAGLAAMHDQEQTAMAFGGGSVTRQRLEGQDDRTVLGAHVDR